jgi:hypothetical protein
MATSVSKPMSVVEIDTQIARLWHDFRAYVQGEIPGRVTPVECLQLIDELLDLRLILTH